MDSRKTWTTIGIAALTIAAFLGGILIPHPSQTWGLLLVGLGVWFTGSVALGVLVAPVFIRLLRRIWWDGYGNGSRDLAEDTNPVVSLANHIRRPTTAGGDRARGS